MKPPTIISWPGGRVTNLEQERRGEKGFLGSAMAPLIFVRLNGLEGVEGKNRTQRARRRHGEHREGMLFRFTIGSHLV
ncbi:protein of unknown function [Candidatus Promineifilum breve]|uniref:Uncharacterized protein n=1 Tax=Candidatus Promineifilum breve TaxID=1806508 RepID=A0A160T331_9CHLR|nr:protein of unknown function [Candidatus Promineifilum breve]